MVTDTGRVLRSDPDGVALDPARAVVRREATLPVAGSGRRPALHDVPEDRSEPGGADDERDEAADAR